MNALRIILLLSILIVGCSAITKLDSFVNQVERKLEEQSRKY